MRVGFGLLSCQIAPGDGRSWADVYEEALDLCSLGDRLGLDTVWTTEHHFVDDGYMPSLLTMSAAIAARTETIEIGTGVLLAPLHDPLRLAEDAATVDLISRGRLILGLGLGWSEVEFAAFGASLSTRGRAMEEMLSILPQAWSGEPIDHEGGVYALPPVAVRPTPARRIPIWVGGGAEAAIRRAARLADGFFSNAPAERLASQIAVAQDERRRIGRTEPFAWTHYRFVYLHDDPEAGWRELLPLLNQSRWKYSDMTASATRRPGPVPAAPPPTPEFEAQLRATALVGPPESVAEAVLETQEAAGASIDFVARCYYPGMAPGAQAEQVHRLAEELAPLLRSA